MSTISWIFLYLNRITSAAKQNVYIGGIIGANSQYTDVLNCYVEVVDMEDTTAGNIGQGDGSNGSGGIAGRSCSYLYILNIQLVLHCCVCIWKCERKTELFIG
jgi:hypothetical protein